MRLLSQKILLGRSTFAVLETELNNLNEPTRLIARLSNGELLAWVRCRDDGSTTFYKKAVLRLSKKLRRRISYVFVVPVVPSMEDFPAHFVTPIPLEFS